MRYSGRVEYADARKMRTRNKGYYRVLHWPIWIWVFFLTPGPLTFSLFAHGFGLVNSLWLGLVLLGTGIAGLFGQMPGVRTAPYILRFDEDKPNPLYRKVCYTFAWNAVLNFALMNLAGLIDREHHRRLVYEAALSIRLLPAVRADSAAGRARDAAARGPLDQRRRHGEALLLWHGLVGHDCANVLLILWKTVPLTRTGSLIKLAIYAGMLALMGAPLTTASCRGRGPSCPAK